MKRNWEPQVMVNAGIRPAFTVYEAGASQTLALPSWSLVTRKSRNRTAGRVIKALAMKSFILSILGLVILIASMLMGIFGSAGFCAAIWGSSILDTALGPQPQHCHPAFITFMLIAVPGMLLGAAGALVGIIVPLYSYFGIRYTGSASGVMRNHAMRILRVTEDDRPLL